MEKHDFDATTVERQALPVSKMSDATATVEKLEEAKQLRVRWEGTWQECYDYAMPNRTGFNEQMTGGKKNTDDILDSTAVHALSDFTSKIHNGMVPDGAAWVDFMPGSDFQKEADIKEVRVGLEDIQTDLFEAISDSNASSEMDEALQEVSIGTGILHIDDGGLESPFKFTAVPLTDVYMNVGPFGGLDEIFHPIKVRAENIKIRWPDAVIPDNLARVIKDEPRRPIDLIESTIREWDKPQIQYLHQIIWLAEKTAILTKHLIGEGSSPWVPFRWSRSAGEAWGRGPLLATLPDVRTVNLTVELVLENAERAIAGMWQSDDETINPDTISFVPGTIIAKMPGTRGLEPLQAPGRLDMAQFILSDMRENIRKGLFSEPLGPTGSTPQSATEANFRISDLNRRISSPFGRMVSELVKPTSKRLLYLRRQAGKIQLPRLNGRMIKIVPISPFAKAAETEKIMAIDRFLEQVMGRFGPEMTNIVLKAEEAAKMLATLHGVPESLVRSSAEIKNIATQMQEMSAEKSLDQGAAPADLLKAVA
jgi:hypothetical protein